MSLEFINKAEVLLFLEKLKLFYSFQNELLSFYLSVFITTLIYKFNNSIVSAINFNILKRNLSKIASKEVKIYVFENYFLKKGVVQQLPELAEGFNRSFIVRAPHATKL